MAIDRLVPTSPPPDTTLAYTMGQVQEEIAALWQNSLLRLSVASGSDNIVATANPPIVSYADTHTYVFKVPAANTGPMTINIDGLGPRGILKSNAQPMVSGDLIANQILLLHYDTSIAAFVIVGALASGTSLPPPNAQWDVLQGDAALNWVSGNTIFCGNF